MINLIERFARMGARAKVNDPAGTSARRAGLVGAVRIDILKDRRGEYFDVRKSDGVEVEVVDVRPEDRHLLLLVRDRDARGRGQKQKFLCGHDERAWFVAAVPEVPGVSGVVSAMEALKPRVVREEQARKGVRGRDRGKRRTAAYVRQGEWFFVPRPGLEFDAARVLYDEPIRRGAGKPHLCQQLCRSGGEQVWVSRRYPNGLTDAQYKALAAKERDGQTWNRMVRDPQVFARGTVRHPDHKTLHLGCWHRVEMNTETASRAMANVAFLD